MAMDELKREHELELKGLRRRVGQLEAGSRQGGKQDAQRSATHTRVQFTATLTLRLLNLASQLEDISINAFPVLIPYSTYYKPMGDLFTLALKRVGL